MESDSSYQFSLLSSDPPMSPLLLDTVVERAIDEKTLPFNEDEAEKALEQFGTNAERIRHYYDFMKEQDNMLPTKVAVKHEKSEPLSIQARERGNRTADYMSALEAYNEALCLAPPGTTAMAFAYANRSLLFAKTGFYNFALQNIQLAFENNFPEENRPRLMKRKNNILKKMKKDKDSYELYGSEHEIQLSHQKNPQIPFIVDGLECASNDVYGRHIVTKRDLKPGDVIVLEDPFITAPFKKCPYKSCYNCTAHNFYNLIPCPKSTRVMFCSEACVTNAWKHFYKYECPIIDGLYDWVDNSFAVRAIFKLFGANKNPEKLKKLIQPSTANAFECDFRNANELTKFHLLNSMFTNQDQRPKREILKIIYSCATVLHMVKEWTELKDALEDHELETIFLELLMRFQQIALINNFDIIEPFKRKISPLIHFSSKGIAQGHYLVSSLFAHSCAPNAAVFSASHSGKHGIVVLHPINAGDIIFVTYGLTFATNDKKDRQTFLKLKYQFDCKCVACEDVKRFPMKLASTFIFHLDNSSPIYKIHPEVCRYDEEAQICAEQAKEKISEYILANFNKYPCEAIYAYEGFLLNALHILAFNRPIDLILTQNARQKKCCPL